MFQNVASYAGWRDTADVSIHVVEVLTKPVMQAAAYPIILIIFITKSSTAEGGLLDAGGFRSLRLASDGQSLVKRNASPSRRRWKALGSHDVDIVRIVELLKRSRPKRFFRADTP
ncbi:MAG: hypothetical protein U0075_10325 [Thermomicrobiales bacterium]